MTKKAIIQLWGNIGEVTAVERARLAAIRFRIERGLIKVKHG